MSTLSDVLSGVDIGKNTTGKHFVGASGERIIKHGTCATLLAGLHGKVGCRWKVADVTRALHSVSRVTGAPERPGSQDVLFNNRKCVVVPPGVVDEILKKVRPVAEYGRQGGLYLSDMAMSGFTRQGRS